MTEPDDDDDEFDTYCIKILDALVTPIDISVQTEKKFFMPPPIRPSVRPTFVYGP